MEQPLNKTVKNFMKTISKLLTALLIIFLGLNSVKSQGTLQFNQAKIVSSNLETVPAGKVWKVESIYGQGALCFPYFNTNFATIRYSIGYGAAFILNGTTVVSDAVRASDNHYSDSNCTLNASTNWAPTNPEWKTSYNLLPMWLPANTTIKTTAPSVFLSVIEFNIIP